MKKVLIVLLFIFLINFISAVIISEVELNPEGSDSGNEWVEFYSKEEINLDGYKIINNDGEEILLNGSFKGVYIYVFNTQWLDNTDEKIVLYDGDKLIDSTDILDDGKNNDLTWQFCDNWYFIISSKNNENACVADDDEETTEIDEEESEDEEIETEEQEEEDDDRIMDSIDDKMIKLNNGISENKTKVEKKFETIELNVVASQNIKSEDYKKSLSKENYAKYGLGLFCVFLCSLFAIKKIRIRKNEFR